MPIFRTAWNFFKNIARKVKQFFRKIFKPKTKSISSGSKKTTKVKTKPKIGPKTQDLIPEEKLISGIKKRVRGINEKNRIVTFVEKKGRRLSPVLQKVKFNKFTISVKDHITGKLKRISRFKFELAQQALQSYNKSRNRLIKIKGLIYANKIMPKRYLNIDDFKNSKSLKNKLSKLKEVPSLLAGKHLIGGRFKKIEKNLLLNLARKNVDNQLAGLKDACIRYPGNNDIKKYCEKLKYYQANREKLVHERAAKMVK